MSRTLLHRRMGRLIKMARLAKQQGLSVDDVFALRAENLERRKFLKQAALAAAAVYAVPTFTGRRAFAQSRSAKTLNKTEPVLIIGAGAAGLAAGYVLNKAGVPFIIAEASNRHGGRIFTEYRGVNASNQFVERGAELVDTPHVHLRALAAELGVDLETFADGDSGLEKDIFQFSGTTYKEEDFVHAIEPFLENVDTVLKQIKGKFYGDDNASVNYKTANEYPADLKKYDNMTMEKFLDAQKGSVDAWILKALSVAYTGEMGLEPSLQSSLNLIDLIDTDTKDGFNMFGDSDEVDRIKGGNSVLIEKIYSNISNNNQKKVVAKGLVLTEIRVINGEIRCIFNDGEVIQDAKQVICAVPFSVLREVKGINQLGLSPVKVKAINEFGYGQNSKVMLSFNSRFWRQSGGKVPANSGSIYCDLPSQSFWETSRLQSGQNGILTNFLGGQAGLNAGADTAVTAVADLASIYGSIASEQYGGAVAMNWNKMPGVKASYGCLLPGQTTSIFGAAGEAELNNQLFFAGEHCSQDWQGFMEGAYETGVKAANELLVSRGLSPIEIVKEKAEPEAPKEKAG